MSDTADKQSKTFDPTPRRLKQARDEGQVAQSKEVPTAVMVMAAGIACYATGQNVMSALLNGAAHTFRRSVDASADMSVAIEAFGSTMGSLAAALMPFTLMILAGATLANLVQTGIVVSPKALAPKWERIDPIKRFKELLGPGPALMRVSVAVLKLIFIGIVVGLVAAEEISDVQLIGSRDVSFMLGRLGSAIVKILISAGLALCIVALIDFAYQKHRHISQLKMTRDEVKKEQKEDEGTPEVKSKRKVMHRELSMNRIMQEVPNADVIVTNPTHFAVALRYDTGSDFAPRVVAKGTDQLAMTIRRIARKNGVPVVENRLLARTLWRKVKVGRYIPMDLFQAVAEVLAHVYRIKKRLGGNA